MVNVGTVVVEPDLFCPWVFTAAFVIEEDHICFYAICIEYPVGGEGRYGHLLVKGQVATCSLHFSNGPTRAAFK